MKLVNLIVGLGLSMGPISAFAAEGSACGSLITVIHSKIDGDKIAIRTWDGTTVFVVQNDAKTISLAQTAILMGKDKTTCVRWTDAHGKFKQITEISFGIE